MADDVFISEHERRNERSVPDGATELLLDAVGRGEGGREGIGGDSK